MECHACGTNLPDDARFCAKCGAEQTAGPHSDPAPIELSGGTPPGLDESAVDFGEPFADAVEPSGTGEDSETVFDASSPEWEPEVQAAVPETFNEQPSAYEEPAASYGEPAGFDAPEQGFAEETQDYGSGYGPDGGYGGMKEVPPPQEAYQAAESGETRETGPDRAEMEETLVGRNYDRFRPSFDKFRSANGFAATWCWPAFFFGMWWYLYRRMYAWIAIDIAMFLVIIPVLTAIFVPMVSLVILWPVTRGILAKYSYYRRIQSKVETAVHDYKTESMKREYPAGFRGYLATVGGPLNIAYVLVPLAAFLVFGLFFGGILAAIAIPNFLKYQAKSKQADVKAGLKALYAAEEGYRSQHGRYSSDFAELNLDLSGQRGGYCYYLGDGIGQPGGCDNYAAVDGVEAWVSDDAFVAVAIGNIDSDPDQDVWAIDESGTIYTIQDDV